MYYNTLKEAAKAQKVTIKALAKDTGLNRERVGSILAGRVDTRMSELEAIAAHLGLTVRIAPRIRCVSLKELGEMDKGGFARLMLDYLQGTVSIGPE